MRKLLLIDGNALMHRAYHGMPPLTTSKGEQVNAVFGFVSLFLRAHQDLQPQCVVFAFDRSAPTFRHKLSDDYKATRQKMEEDLARQIPRLKQVVKAFGMPVLEMDGFEADDIIGTISLQAYQQDSDIHIYILTADMDAAQLVNERTSIYTAKQKLSEVITYDVKGIEDKFGGLKPTQIVDYKALRGDTSDNIPGVPGIGEKTAIQLLIEYGNLDSVYQNIKKLKPRTQELLNNGKDSAYLSRKLATIDRQAPVQLDFEACDTRQYNVEAVVELFKELEFRSLIDKLPAIGGIVSKQSSNPPTDYKLIQNADELKQLIDDIKKEGKTAFDTEGTGVTPWDADMVGISLSIKSGTGAYIPFAGWSKSLIKELLEDPEVEIIAHHAKFDEEMANQSGININNLTFDTMLAAFILKEGVGKYGLKELAFSELGITATQISELIGSGSKQITMDQVPLEQVAPYAAADADHTWQLYQIYLKQFQSQPELLKLFNDIEMPVSRVLAVMEQTGVRLDTGLLKNMSGEVEEQLKVLEKGIYDSVGHEFNLNSPKQLAEVLFDELKLPAYKKTKTGRSTDESVLAGLKTAHPAVEQLLQFREMFKLKSTYLDALPALVSARDGRLHTSYNQAVAATGRLSSTNPNLQNIPIRSEVGRRIRQAFLADPGQRLVSVDYSQIELRILAHVSQDPALLDAFASGQDVHAATAAKVFECAVDQVTSDQRRAAKTINFGIMYGQSAYGLSQQLGITRVEADTFIKDYFAIYKDVKKYLDESIKLAHQNGYVQTLAGRRRRIPELASSNFQLRSGAERMAINMPIQGTAADIIKIAMINIQRYIEKEQNESKMILQVHDELVFTIAPNELDTLLSVIVDNMEHAMELSVPLNVEAKVGNNWGEMTPIEAKT